MVIISLEFARFVLISLVVFYLLPGKLQNIFLLLVSYYFYGTWSWGYVAILVLITIFNYYYALFLTRFERKVRYPLRIGIGINLAVFGLFLFGDFFGLGLRNLVAQFGYTNIEVSILLPLGFSYYVMECISYLIDTRLRVTKPSQNLLDFALYLAYFPKLISGPIERSRKFIPQITGEKTVDNVVLARSAMLVFVGLLQSVVLGGLLTVLAPTFVLKQPQHFFNTQLVMGLLGYAVFLYTQFAGYTKIVRGVSGFFGIDLSRNFVYPVFSRDFSDFWNRWHISLSQWLRDYVYLPLSRAFLRRNPSRTNKGNLVVPPLATMIASGLWHGASLNLILWGVLNGFYVVFENILNLYRPAKPDKRRPLPRRVLSTTIVILLGLGAAIPFWMDLPTSKVFIYQLIYGWERAFPDLRVLWVMAATIFLDWLQFRCDDEFVFLKWPRWAQALSTAFTILLVIVVYNLQNAPTTFVYP